MDPSKEDQTAYYKNFFSKHLPNPGNLLLSIETPQFELSDFKSYCAKNGVIYQMAPVIADFLKRSVSFNKILEVFYKYDHNYNDSFLKYQKISIRNLLEFFLEICSEEAKSAVGVYLAKMQMFIPISYWKYSYTKNTLRFKNDFSVLYSQIPQLSTRLTILNFGLDSNIGKTSILSKLFGIKEERLNISDGNGLSREGTVDLYLTKNLVLIDINSFWENPQKKKFFDFFKKLLKISNGFIFHVRSNKGEEYITSTLKKLKDLDFDETFRNTFFLLRDFPEKKPKVVAEVKNCIEKMKGFPDSGLFALKKLSEGASSQLKAAETFYLKEEFDKWLAGFLSARKHKKKLTLSKIIMKFSHPSVAEESIENFLVIENFFQKALKNSQSPYESLLPFSCWQYMEFKGSENMEETKKKELANVPGFKFEDLLSYRLAKYAIEGCSFELKKIDEKIRESTSTYCEALKEKIAALNSDYKRTQSNETKASLDELVENLTNNTISSHDLYAEIFAYYDFKKNEKLNRFSVLEEKFYNRFRGFFAQELLNGAKLHLFRGIPLRIKNEFLKEVFSLPQLNSFQYFVISILGMQSSGKSTLLNYLFGSSFETSAGRCTRGIYANIINTQDKNIKILLLDTEGLASIESNDETFDHKIALMCLGLSDLVLVNHNGDISKHIQDLLSISLYAMNFFQQMRGCVPKVFFILRNQIDRDQKNQEIAYEILENELLGIIKRKKLEQRLRLSKEYFFLLPSAFNDSLPSEIFGEEILKLRGKIWEQVEKEPRKRKILDIYINACVFWELFTKYGRKLLSCKSLKEYETKLMVEEKFKNLGIKKTQELSSKVSSELHEKWKNMEKEDKLDIFSMIKKSFAKCLNELEKKEVKDFRKEYDGFPQILDHAFQDLKDFMKCEENNLIYLWEMKFKQKSKDLRLKEYEESFLQNINAKMKSYLGQRVDESEMSFEAFVDDMISKFLAELDQEFHPKNKEKEMDDVIRIFNGIKRTELDDCTIEEVKKFEKNGFCKEKWRSHHHLKSNADDTIQYNLNSIKSVGSGNRDITLLEGLIKAFFHRLTNDPLMFSLEEPKCQEFFNFMERLRADRQLSDLNFDIIQYELCYHFISEITKKIGANKERQHLELQANYKAKVEKKRAEYLEIYNNRKNDIKTVEILCVNYLNKIVKVKLDRLQVSMLESIEEKLKKLPTDPEKFLELTYKESFVKRDPEAIYNFVTDINAFVASIFKREAKEVLSIAISKMEESFPKCVDCEISVFKDTVKNFLISQKETTNSEELFGNIKRIYNEVDLAYDQFFPKEVKTEDLLKFIKYTNFKAKMENQEGLRKSLEDSAKRFVQGKKVGIMGCQSICPSCKSKCIKAAGNHENHKAYHILNCFGGVQKMHSKEVVKFFCLEKKNVEFEWVHSGKIYPNLIEMCKTAFPKWVEDFSINPHTINKKEKENQLICWFYVHKPILKKYGAKDLNLENFLNEAHVLPENHEEIVLKRRMEKKLDEKWDRTMKFLRSEMELRLKKEFTKIRENELLKYDEMLKSKEEKWKKLTPNWDRW